MASRRILDIRLEEDQYDGTITIDSQQEDENEPEDNTYLATQLLDKPDVEKWAGDELEEENNYRATLSLPVVTQRQRELLHEYRTGGLLSLWQCMARLWQADLEKLHGPVAVSKRGEASLKAMIADCEDETSGCETLLMLCALPAKAIEPLILNTIAHEWINRKSFRELFTPPDHTVGGYLNCIMLEDSGGQFLNSSHIDLLAEAMSRYARHGRGPNKLDMEFADHIDRQVHGADERAMAKGERRWKTDRNGANIKIFQFILRLRDRSTGYHILQSPCEIGYSSDLYTRMKAHLPKNRMTTTTAIWGLVTCCLRYLDIPHNVVQIPLLRVWSQTMEKKVEPLLSMLTGSMVEDGGFNIISGGGNSFSKRHGGHYDAEERDVFITHSHFQDNLALAKAEMEERKEIITFLSDHGILDSTKDSATLKAMDTFIQRARKCETKLIEEKQWLDKMAKHFEETRVNAIEAFDDLEHLVNTLRLDLKLPGNGDE